MAIAGSNYLNGTNSNKTISLGTMNGPLQGNSQPIQGNTQVIQGSSPNLQATVNPQAGVSYSLAPSQAEIDAANARAAAAQRAATTGAINSAFAAPQANWDALYANNDRARDFNTGQVSADYNTQRGGIDLSNAQGNENLNRSEGNVAYTKSSTLRDLSKNISASMDSRMRTIGLQGGGSSSAGYQLATALHGVQNDSRGQIFDQAGQQFGDINVQRGQLKDTYNQTVKQLDDWKVGQIAKITNDYLNEKSKIDQDKSSGNAQQSAAVAQQSIALAKSAAANLAQIQSMHTNAINSLGYDASGARTASANTMANTNYQVQALDGGNPAITYAGGSNPTMGGYPMGLVNKKNQYA